MSKPLLSDIKTIVWDLDGTLYRGIPELNQRMQEEFIKILAQKKSLSFEESSELFEKTKQIYKSASKSLSALGCGSPVSLIKIIEEKIDKSQYLKVNPKLQSLFIELSSFRHILLSNSTHKTIISELEALGISHTIFELTLGIDDTGTVKPDPSFFKLVFQHTNLPESTYLMVGDRVEVDLMPAKQLGMKTCLVWDSKTPEGVDFSLATVYDVGKLFAES